MKVWYRGDGGRWQAHAIPGGGLAIGLDAEGTVSLGDRGSPRVGPPVAQLVPLVLRGSSEIALVVAPRPSAIRVGGLPPLCVALLDDRAEIALGRERLYLTRSSPAAIERFDPVGGSACCSRCTRVLRSGDSILCCGACGGAHHEGELAEWGELRCASYDAVCALCRRNWQAVDWTPEELV